MARAHTEALGQRPAAAQHLALPRLGPVLGGALIAATYLFLLAPILIVVASSVQPNNIHEGGLTLRWYRDFLDSDSFKSAFVFSLWLGAIAATIATVVGFFAAYAILRLMGGRRALGQSLIMLPVMIPHILISLSLLLMLTVVPIPELLTLILGHVIICLPFTVAGILASLEGVDPRLELAARTLGASRFTVLWEVTIPLIAPGLLSALIFAFIISFGDVYIALFLSGAGLTTLPIEIFTYMLWDSTPVVAAITTVQIAMIVLLGLVIERLVGLRKLMRI